MNNDSSLIFDKSKEKSSNVDNDMRVSRNRQDLRNNYSNRESKSISNLNNMQNHHQRNAFTLKSPSKNGTGSDLKIGDKGNLNALNKLENNNIKINANEYTGTGSNLKIGDDVNLNTLNKLETNNMEINANEYAKFKNNADLRASNLNEMINYEIEHAWDDLEDDFEKFNKKWNNDKKLNQHL